MPYSQAQIDAMNRSGLALLKSQKNKTYKPPTPVSASSVETKPYTVPSGSAGSTGQLSGLPYLYTPPAGATSSGTQTSGGSYGSRAADTKNFSSDTYTVNSGSTTLPNLSPSPDPTPTPGLNDINSAIDDYALQQKESMLTSLRSAFDQNRNNLNAQRPQIQQEATGLRNQTDTTYYRSLPELYKAMESAGQRGGENITGNVALNTVRGQGINEANLYEQNQLRGIDTALLNLDSQQAQAIAEAEQGISSDVFAQRLTALKDAMTQQTADRNLARQDAINTIGAYSNDYQARINTLKNDNDTTNDWLIPYLMAARSDKITSQDAAAAEAEQQAIENAQAWARIYKSGSSSQTLSVDDAMTKYTQGDRSDAVVNVLRAAGYNV